ncbi:MAG: hypothetical protein M3310_08570, partial [Actinomycetota bacterium]|nr:hypothetical protein [Actinomycetota bacterium]
GDAAEDHALRRVPFPKYSVGLLQSESEMVQVPAYDLLPSLEQDLRWDVELSTERTVRAFLHSADRFDCIVIGYNAARSAEIRDALAESSLPVGVLVLHQFEPRALSFLHDEPLTPEKLSTPADDARPPPGSDTHEEILLNWPQPVILRDGVLEQSKAHLAVTPTLDSRWETVLEVQDHERRVPVLVRTHAERWPPRAVSAVLLAPRHPQHLALLGNLITWCAAGRPSAVVVEPASGPSVEIVHRKLRLQGVKAVIEPIPDQAKLDFYSWPLWGTRDVLLPGSWDPTKEAGWPRDDPHQAKPWLRRGHRIILLGPGDSLTVRHGESDAHWVARRWATWFKSVPAATWHGGHADGQDHPGSLVATRSILRMLALLHGVGRGARLPGLDTALTVLDDLDAQGIGIDPVALGVPHPDDVAEPVADLLLRRVGAADNVDDTVSATIAALDIDALLDGRPLGGRSGALRAWLTRELPHRALEDRLEIARRLGDAELLAEIVASAAGDTRLDEPVSAVLVTALRSAIVSCGLGPDTPLSAFSLDPERAVVHRELRMRPILAAVYLLGVLDLQRVWDAQDAEPARTLRDPPPERVDRAIITLGRHGPLARGQAGWEPPVPELASTEALALIAYFARHPVPTHVVRDGDAVPPQVLGALLREAENVRRANEELDHELARRKDAATRGGRALAIAGELLIVGFVIVFGLVLAPHVDSTWEVPSAFVLWTLLTLGLLALLGRYQLPVRGARQIAPLLAGGWDAVRTTLAQAVASEPKPPPPRAEDEGEPRRTD